MRIGVSLTSRVMAAPDAPTSARWIVERARAAERGGLDLLSVGDHHNVAAVYLQNTPMLGRLLAEWGPRPSGCLFLLPLWNPLLAAEQIATLAALAPSTFVVQTGTGGGDYQFDGMGMPISERGVAHEESIELIQAMLAGETVSSTRFGITDARVGMNGLPPIEWWIGGGVANAVARAGRLGDVFYALHDFNDANADARLAPYLAACSERGVEPRVALRRDAVILDDGDEARRLASDLLAGGYRGMDETQLLIGSPEDAAEQVRPYVDRGWEITVRAMAVPQGAALETIENLAAVRALF